MALQPGAVVVPEKVPAQWYNATQLQPPITHPMDEREGFTMWLRGEFAAANAIIDALCHHLRAVGEPGEYEGVIGSIQQRRRNWNPVLYMQQYFSVAEVVYGLEQAGFRRQQQKTTGPGFEGNVRVGGGGKDYRRGGGRGHNSGGDVNGKDLNNGYAKSHPNVSEKLEGGDKVEEKDDKKESNEKTEADSTGSGMRQENSQEIVTHDKADAAVSCHVNESAIVRDEKMSLPASSRTFIATEIFEGEPVNIAEGLKLYEDLFDYSEISKITNMVNELRAAGRSRLLKGQTFITLKRPMMGHGREIIQMGVPIADTLLDDVAATETSKDVKTEPIPEFLQEVIERLISKKLVDVKPDSTIIDFFNEGDYSQPSYWPHSFGRTVCVLFLTECEMAFSKVITIDRPGDYRGALQLSLSPGSILVMQGRSVDFTRHAIPTMRKQRVLVTLVKSQPKKINASGDFNRFPSTSPPPSSNWTPPPSRSPGHIRIAAPKHFVPDPPVGVLPLPASRPPNNGSFVPGHPAVTPPARWPAAPLRPHLPVVPGTGVFLPSQGSSGNSSNESGTTVEAAPAASKENGVKKPSGGPVSIEVCNGSTIEEEREK